MRRIFKSEKRWLGLTRNFQNSKTLTRLTCIFLVSFKKMYRQTCVFGFQKFKKCGNRDLRRFMKRISCLQKEKTCFWSNFHVYKMKNAFLKHFSCLQNENYVFEANLFLQNVNYVFEEFSCLQNKKHVFWAFFMFTKWKNTFMKRFSCLQKEKNLFLKQFSCLQNENHLFWSVFHV